MNVSLTPEMDKWITQKVKSGLYKSSSEVVRESLRLLQQREEQLQAMQEDLQSELLIGARQLDTGKSRNFNAALVKKIKRTGRKKLGG